ncbi:MAG: rod shape-determining protein MreC [Alphaproteobacteria bacterium]|nr:rod shape-determining protein MreC [Alphaproteobacteria bacterium]
MKRRRVLFIHLSQSRVFLQKIAVLVCLLFALVLMTLSKVEHPFVLRLKQNLSTIINPIVNIVRLPSDGVYYVYTSTHRLIDACSENKALTLENERLRLVEQQNRILKIENKFLSDMLNYMPFEDVQFVTAKVIALKNDGFVRMLTVYVGQKNLVKKGQVVLHRNNVIGRIDSVDGAYAQVLLLSDISSKIPVMIERTQTRGILSGNNTGTLNLLYPSSDFNEPLMIGDKVITSGVGGIFPSGLTVGRIIDVSTHEIKVEAVESLDSLEFVYIVDYHLETPQDGAETTP